MTSLAMVSRLVVGSAAGLLLFMVVAGSELDGAGRFAFVVEVRADAPTTAQLFFDRGQGFAEAESSTAPVEGGSGGELRLPVPVGRYRALRFDPGTAAGEYQIDNARIEDGAGHIIAAFSPRAFEATNDATAVRRDERTLFFSVRPPQLDPQLLAVFGEPLIVAPQQGVLGWLALLLLVCIASASVVITLADILLLKIRPARHERWVEAPWATANAVLVVASVSALAGVLSAYPLLMGRSVVAPATGGSVMMYDRPPYVYGSDDVTIEEVRGSDTGSMMWGIMPYSQVQREAIKAGEWPLWQRYSGLGRPLWGQGQSMFLDPIHLLSLAIEDPSTGWDLKFFYARTFFAVGAGLAALAATSSVFASVMVGVAAPFVGAFMFRLNHPATFSLVYTPWLLWALVSLSRQRRWQDLTPWVIVTAVATDLQLVAGAPKEGVVALLACQLTGGLAVLLATGTGAERARRLLAFGVAGVMALLISAPHWLVFLDTLSRAWTVYDSPAVRLAAWPHLASLALGAVASGTLWPGANMLVVTGMVLALVAPLDARGRAIWWASWITVIACVAVSLGAVPMSWLVRIPLLRNLYSINTSFFSAAVPPMLLVAAFGFAHLGAILSSRVRRLALVVAGLAVAALVFTWQGGLGAVGSPSMIWVALTLGAAMLFPWVAWAWLGCARTRVAGATMVTLVVVMVAPGGLHLDTGIPQLDRQLMQPRPRADVDEPSPAVTAARGVSDEPFRAIGLGSVFFAGTQALYGIEGIVGADAIEWPYLRELGTAAGMFRHPWIWLSLFSAEDLQNQSGLLDMLGVRVVFSPPEVSRSSWHPLAMARGDLVRAFERPSAWPRAFFTDRVQRYETPADLVSVLQAATAPFAAVQTSDAEAVEATSALTSPGATVVAASGYHLTPNTTTFTVTAPSAGIVVLGEAYEPADFKVTVNGAPAPYFRVNHMLKAVSIPAAGRWTVTFEFRPRLWGVSWLIFWVGVALLIGVALSGRPFASVPSRHPETA